MANSPKKISSTNTKIRKSAPVKRKRAKAVKKSSVRSRSPKVVKFPCVEFTQAGKKFYFFVADGKTLWSVVDINRRAEDTEVGYQRAASPSRVNKIAEYIDKENVLPTSLLVNFDDAELIDQNTLVIPNKKGVGWVIDGQHRLAGSNQSERNIDLPVIASVGLKLDEQIELFVTINKEQKGVPSSLYLELLERLPKRLTDADIAKQMATEVARSLKSDESSPFFARIVSTASPKSHQISTTNFVRKFSPHLMKTGRFRFLTHEQRHALINNYYKGLSIVFPAEYRADDSVFFRTVGFGGLMNALPVVFDLVVSHSKAFKLEDVVTILKKIDSFEFSSWRQMGTGNAAELQAGDDLQTELRDAFSNDGSLRGVEF